MLTASILAFPSIDPVLLQVGPLAIRWYALAYVAGIFLGWYLLKALNRRTTARFPDPTLDQKALDDIITYAILGIILGGRLGYVLFYNPGYYLHHPIEALYIWHGGMSFHGGFLGVLAAMWLFARRFGIRYFRLMDMLAVCAPIGLFFGRLANFINGELWGRVSDVPWAMVFPTGGPDPRHPSQLYEGLTEGLLLFLVLLFLALRTRIRDHVGALSGLFLLGYSLSRMVVEQFRQPDAGLGFLFTVGDEGVTMGQILSFPMFGFAFLLLYLAFATPFGATLRRHDPAA